MTFFANLSIRYKVAGVILVATLLSLGTGFALVVFNNLKLFEQDLLRTTQLIARATGNFNAINLVFDEPEMAAEALAQLESFDYITDAHLYNNSGELIASYQRAAKYTAPTAVEASTSEVRNGYVFCTEPVVYEGEHYGTIYVRGTTDSLAERRRQHFVSMATLLALLVVVGGVLSYALQGFVSKPILHLAEKAQDISDHNDYSVRVEKPGSDEIGMLYDGFNDMLSQIQLRQEELERSNRDLDQFAYVASHDLKAPLRAISTLAGWIEEDIDDQLSDEARQQMELLRSRVRRMDALIEGVLQYSRAGRMNSAGELVDVGKLLSELIELLDPPPGMTLDVVGDMPTFFTKRLRLEQVFSNLITNAIKYHDRDEGRIEIAVEGDNDHWIFTVEDDGPGIAPEHHDRVFVMFQTLQPRDEIESTGLGLALVKKLVEEEGGKITLESKEGRGARFCFTWPPMAPPDSAPGGSSGSE